MEAASSSMMINNCATIPIFIYVNNIRYLPIKRKVPNTIRKYVHVCSNFCRAKQK